MPVHRTRNGRGALLNRLYDAMAAEISETGGQWRVRWALYAALSMQRRLEELFGGGLSLRIGVHRRQLRRSILTKLMVDPQLPASEPQGLQ